MSSAAKPKDILGLGDGDEIEILLRYDHMFRSLVNTSDWVMDGLYGKEGLVDWSLSYAIQGPHYFDMVHWHINLAVLRNSMVFVITMIAYCYPPAYDSQLRSDVDQHAYFVVMIGVSAVAHMSSVISYKLFELCCHKPYTLADAMLSRVKNHWIYIFGMYFEAKGMLSLLGAMMMARTGIMGDMSRDGGILLFLIILALWTWTLVSMDEVQERKIRRFHRKYVDATTGCLQEAVLQRIYRPPTLKKFLEAIGQVHHLHDLRDFDLEAVWQLRKEDFWALFGDAASPRTPNTPGQRNNNLVDAIHMAEECQKARKLQLRT
jgi:hypothetical protein